MGKEELLRALLSGAGDISEMRPVSGKERERAFEEMQHLDLSPGDRVRWISSGYKDCKTPGVDDVVEVFRVFPVRLREPDGTGSSSDEMDFSVLFNNSGTLVEYLFDSRRFKLVE